MYPYPGDLCMENDRWSSHLIDMLLHLRLSRKYDSFLQAGCPVQHTHGLSQSQHTGHTLHWQSLTKRLTQVISVSYRSCGTVSLNCWGSDVPVMSSNLLWCRELTQKSVIMLPVILNCELSARNWLNLKLCGHLWLKNRWYMWQPNTGSFNCLLHTEDF